MGAYSMPKIHTHTHTQHPSIIEEPNDLLGVGGGGSSVFSMCPLCVHYTHQLTSDLNVYLPPGRKLEGVGDLSADFNRFVEIIIIDEAANVTHRGRKEGGGITFAGF